jgi:hypothetical protein
MAFLLRTGIFLPSGSQNRIIQQLLTIAWEFASGKCARAQRETGRLFLFTVPVKNS